jgi:hypothetical protein
MNTDTNEVPSRKLGSDIPTRLIAHDDGALTMMDGSNAQEYIQKWMEKHELEDGQTVHIITTETLAKLEYGCLIAECHGA